MPTTEHVASDSYESQETELMTGEAVALELRPASFIVRAAGAIIDYLVYFGGYILLFIFLLPPIVTTLGLNSAVMNAVSIVFLVLFIVVAPMVVETLSHGKSLGRLALGTRIVRDDGGAAGFRHAFIRSLVGVLDIYMTFGGFAAVTSLLTARSKRLGDLLAGTFSQYERYSKEPRPVYGVPADLAQWALTADVGRMPDRLVRRIAQFLAQAAHLSGSSRDRIARELAHEAAPYVSPLPSVSAELFLAAITALRREREATALELEKSGLERLEPVLTGRPHGFPER
jgi:uncharacterized RDD family membrane protein YckC